MPHVDYPTMLPVECATTLFDIVRNKQTGERSQELCHCAWNLSGYALRVTVGQPVEGLSAADCELDEAGCKELEDCKANLVSAQEDLQSAGLGADGFAMDPVLVNMLISLAIKAIEEAIRRWVDKRKS